MLRQGGRLDKAAAEILRGKRQLYSDQSCFFKDSNDMIQPKCRPRKSIWIKTVLASYDKRKARGGIERRDETGEAQRIELTGRTAMGN
jgi:hypothetical protein